MRNKLFATAKGVISLSWFIAVLLLFVAVAGVINGVICVAGGYNNSGTLATVEAFTSSTSPLLQSQTYFGGQAMKGAMASPSRALTFMSSGKMALVPRLH